MNREQTIENMMNDFGSLKREIVTAHHYHCKHDITPAQGQVLFLVHHHRQLTTSSLAKILGISVSATTQLCEPLVKNGFLLRQPNPDDGRSFPLALSPKSSRFLGILKNGTLDRFGRLFKPLSDQELDQFSILIHKIINHIENDKQNT